VFLHEFHGLQHENTMQGVNSSVSAQVTQDYNMRILRKFPLQFSSHSVKVLFCTTVQTMMLYEI
jgi:hypothetical protein